MQLTIGTVNIKPIAKYPVVAIGNFDGLHLGHKAILAHVVSRAREKGGTAVVLTFEPHPSKVLVPDRELRLLYPFQAKMRLIESAGIDVVCVAEFNKNFAQHTPYEFVKEFLHDKLGCKEVIVGENFRFGKGRAGDVDDLIRFGKEFGFHVITEGPVLVDGLTASSSKIREFISEGNVGLAGKLLGRAYALEGKVIHGDHTGKALGFPTANLHLPNELVPKNGIYAARITILKAEGSPTKDGIVYIGPRPTLGQRETQVEAHLFDYNENLYGKRLMVTLLDWIRGDEKFPDLNALARQMEKDAEKARSILKQKEITP